MTRSVQSLALWLLPFIALAFLLLTEGLALPWVIVGESMSPVLLPGDRVIVDVWSYRQRPPRPGEVALFLSPTPYEERMVKRVTGRDRGGFRVLGENPPRSRDSREFGPVPRERFSGRLVWRYWPPSRAGSIR